MNAGASLSLRANDALRIGRYRPEKLDSDRKKQASVACAPSFAGGATGYNDGL
jgi:hypothetical protein